MSVQPGIAALPDSAQSHRRDLQDLRTIAYGGGAYLLASVMGNGLNYCFGIFLARTLGADEFGLFALALTVFNVVCLTVVFGLDNGAIRMVSQHLAAARLANARLSVTAAVLLGLAAGMAAAIALGVLAHPLASRIYQKPALNEALLVFAAAIPFASATTVLLACLQAYQKIQWNILIKYVWEPTGKFLLTLFALWMGFGLLAVLTSILVALVASFLLSAWAVFHVIFEGSPRDLSWSAEQAGALVTYSMPLAVSNLVGVVAPRADILLLGYWYTTAEVGIYLASFQTAAVMALVLGAFNTAFAPLISRACMQDDQERIRSSYQTISRFSLIVALPIFCCLVVFGEDILAIFGRDFTAGWLALVILASGQLFNAATGAANTILLMSGYSRVVMTNTIIMGLALLMGAIVLIPYMGLLGAAIAASCTFVVTNVVRALQVWRLHSIHPYSFGLVRPVAIAGVATLFAYVPVIVDPSIPIHLSVVLLCVLYLLGVWRYGLSPDDRYLLSSALPQGRRALGEPTL